VDTPPWKIDDAGFLSHPLLRPGTVEYRQFQADIAMEALSGNSLVVTPTGLGKTIIAALVIAERLAQVGGKALIVAPSRPLADQHALTLDAVLTTGSTVCLTGSESQRKRAGRWGTRRIFAATPQVAVNDLKRGLLPSDLTVVVFDEAHRAVGDYSYVSLAKDIRAICPDALYLGITASPGHEIEHIEEVCANLFIKNVILRSRDDPDVAPYVQKTDIDWIEVQPSEIINKVSGYMTAYYIERLNKIRRFGFLRQRKNTQVRIQDLNAASGQIFAMRKQGRAPYLFQASRQVALARTAHHAILCIERQGVDSFVRFLEPKLKPGRSRFEATFVNDQKVKRAFNAAKRWKGPSHPKLEPLVRTVKEQVARKPDSKIIVFAELRDTVEFLVKLFKAEGVNVEHFVGQGTRQGRKGMTQKEQRESLARFSSSVFQVMCATSIAEEGLDVPQVDLVIFYEPVASDVRLIQRKGRTGRDAPGRVVILTTDKTADERYLWSGLKREKRMKRLVRKMADESMERSLEEAGGTRVSAIMPAVAAPKPKLAGQSRLTDF